MDTIFAQILGESMLCNLDEVDKILLVDTRPYISHNEGHIKGSCNMYCPPILKRRFSRGGSVHLESMLGPETKNKLMNGYFERIVLYDENCNLEVDGELYIVWKCMAQLGVSGKCTVLEGGYQLFRVQFPELCTSPESEFIGSMSTSIAEKLQRNTLFRTNSTQVEPVEILPHLYIGNANTAASLEEIQHRGITAVLNVSANCHNHFAAHLQYKNIAVDDSHSTELSLWFKEAIDFIDEVNSGGGKTLVHCQAGISRSATICLAYVMQNQNLSLDAAFEFVKSRRNEISPNASFLQQLLQFEKELQSENSISSTSSSPCAFFSVSSTFPGCSPLEMTSPFSSPFSSPTALCSPMITFT